MFSSSGAPKSPQKKHFDINTDLLNVEEDRQAMIVVDSAHVEAIKERVVGKKKQYAFVVNVVRSDGTSSNVWRSYSDFFYFQCQLLDSFPEEAGAVRGCERSIPYLPGRKIFRKSDLSLAEERKPDIESYMTDLLKLPPKISQSSLVVSFFQKWQSDPECFSQFPLMINRLGDHEVDNASEYTATKGVSNIPSDAVMEDELTSHLNYTFEASGCQEDPQTVKGFEAAIKC